MDTKSKELCRNYIIARRSNPAWRLLAARRAPLVLSCLKQLSENRQDGIAYEDGVQLLAQILEMNVNNEQFDINTDDFPALAARELRQWTQKKLLVERKGRLLATDALEKVLQFMDSLDERMMTSTASRLATVQREIENLETRLNPDPESRTVHLQKQIRLLEKELKKVQSGRFDVLKGEKAVEGIREVYSLAMSLKSDFRRVDDTQDLELEKQTMRLDDIENEFWEAFDDLDREKLIQRTMDVLFSSGEKMSLSELSKDLLSSHDLETLSFWIGMARQAGLPILEGREFIDYQNRAGQWFRFNVPKMELNEKALKSIDMEDLG